MMRRDLLYGGRAGLDGSPWLLAVRSCWSHLAPTRGEPRLSSTNVAWHRRMLPRDTSEEHRSATPLELFFDLCFVVAVAQAASALHHDLAEGQFSTTLADAPHPRRHRLTQIRAA